MRLYCFFCHFSALSKLCGPIFGQNTINRCSGLEHILHFYRVIECVDVIYKYRYTLFIMDVAWNEVGCFFLNKSKVFVNWINYRASVFNLLTLSWFSYVYYSLFNYIRCVINIEHNYSARTTIGVQYDYAGYLNTAEVFSIVAIYCDFWRRKLWKITLLKCFKYYCFLF